MSIYIDWYEDTDRRLYLDDTPYTWFHFCAAGILIRNIESTYSITIIWLIAMHLLNIIAFKQDESESFSRKFTYIIVDL